MTTEQVPTQPEGTEQPPAPPETPPEPQATETQPQGQAPKELREHADRVESENKDLRKRILDTEITALGLDPTTGLGVAIAESYTGSVTDPAAIAEYAKTKYGHEKPQAPTVTGPERAGQLAQQAVQSTPSQAPDEVAKVEEQMGDPAQINRGVIEQSIGHKIGKALGFRQ